MHKIGLNTINLLCRNLKAMPVNAVVGASDLNFVLICCPRSFVYAGDVQAHFVLIICCPRSVCFVCYAHAADCRFPGGHADYFLICALSDHPVLTSA